jgi:hypothetical protein
LDRSGTTNAPARNPGDGVSDRSARPSSRPHAVSRCRARPPYVTRRHGSARPPRWATCWP